MKIRAEDRPYPSERKDSAMDGCACAGPLPFAISILFAAAVQPYVDIPVVGSCPPSDAISMCALFWRCRDRLPESVRLPYDDFLAVRCALRE
jgi:hypothetical protein